jgi:hypothetical protein
MAHMAWAFRVGIIGGTGAEGRGLALRFAQAGVSVVIGSRDPQRAEESAAALAQQPATSDRFVRPQGAANTLAAASAEFVFLAVPFTHAAETLSDCAAVLQPGSVVVDVTVPLVFTPGQKQVQVIDLPEGSGSGHLAGHIPTGVDLVATFKTLPAHLLSHPEEPLDCDEFVCGNSPEARRRVVALLGTLPGLRPVDIGGLEAAATLERMCALAVSINRHYKVKGSRFRVIGL